MVPRGASHPTRLTSTLMDSLSTIHEEGASPEKMPDTLMPYYESLLQGMSIMDNDRAVHQVYSIVLQSVHNELHLRMLAESLHQRWLSDAQFVTAAARLAFQLRDLSTSGGDVTFSSVIFALMMNDYKDRHHIRRCSAAVLCNSAHFAFEFYSIFVRESNFYQCLIDPLLDYLDILVDQENLAETEIELAASLLKKHGMHLQQLRYRRVLAIVINIRRMLIYSAQRMSPLVRCNLMHVIEMAQNRWDADAMPHGVPEFYAMTLLELGETAYSEQNLPLAGSVQSLNQDLSVCTSFAYGAENDANHDNASVGGTYEAGGERTLSDSIRGDQMFVDRETHV